MREIVMPELGEGIEKATVAFWHFKVGDQVRKDEELVEVVTDKAAFNVSADFDGILKQIFVPEGEEAKVGQVLAVFE